MTELLYLDVYFLTNFAMDFVALAVGGLVSSEKVGKGRLLLAALGGALFSLAMVLFPLSLFWQGVLSLVAFFAMILAAFGKRRPRRYVFPALFSFATALFLGGACHFLLYYASAIGGGERLGLGILFAAIFSALGLFSLWGRGMRRRLETGVVSLSIDFGGRQESFYGLVDSGLLLRSPDDPRPVLILKAQYAAPLLPASLLRRLQNGQTEGEEKLFFVPIHTVGSEGILYAFLPDRLTVTPMGGSLKRAGVRDALVALDFSEGGFGGCPCLVPLSVL